MECGENDMPRQYLYAVEITHAVMLAHFFVLNAFVWVWVSEYLFAEGPKSLATFLEHLFAMPKYFTETPLAFIAQATATAALLATATTATLMRKLHGAVASAAAAAAVAALNDFYATLCAATTAFIALSIELSRAGRSVQALAYVPAITAMLHPLACWPLYYVSLAAVAVAEHFARPYYPFHVFCVAFLMATTYLYLINRDFLFLVQLTAR